MSELRWRFGFETGFNDDSATKEGKRLRLQVALVRLVRCSGMEWVESVSHGQEGEGVQCTLLLNVSDIH